MTAKTCEKLTPSFGVSMTSTAVVLGMAMLGRRVAGEIAIAPGRLLTARRRELEAQFSVA
jgi:hypothetical protein